MTEHPAGRGTPDRLRGWMLATLLIGYVAMLAIRVPAIIWPGRFWAEEGSLYFHEAYVHPWWQVILTPHNGYYSLINKIASLLAVYTVPLRYTPLVTVAIALMIQTLPVALFLLSRYDTAIAPLAYIAAPWLLLFVQPNQEVWLNTTNSQFFLCVAAAIIMISRPTGRPTHVARLVVLGLAGLTGAPSILLLPFFVVIYARDRSRRRLHEIIVLGLASALQLIAVLSAHDRVSQAYWDILPFALLVKQIISPLLGQPAADTTSDYIRAHTLYTQPALMLAALLPHICLALCLLLWGRREAIILFVAGVTITSVAFLNAIDSVAIERILFNHLSAFGSGRYYYAPNALLGLALLFPLRQAGGRWPARLFRGASIVMVCLLIAVGAYDFTRTSARHQSYFSGPSWPVEVDNWEQMHGDKLNIWPRRWFIELPHSQ